MLRPAAKNLVFSNGVFGGDEHVRGMATPLGMLGVLGTHPDMLIPAGYGFCEMQANWRRV